MFVQNHMTPNPKTVQPSAPVSEAWELMKLGRFHQLPVIDGNGSLLGIVTDRDIRSAVGYDTQNHVDLKVEEVMTADTVCVPEDATVEEAVRRSCRHPFGAYPVLNGERLVGIISRSDLLRAFHDLLGLEEAGSRIEVAIPHGATDLASVISALTEDDEILSLVAGRLRTDGVEPVLYIRTRMQNPYQLEKRLRSKGAILLAPEKAKATC